MKFLKAEQELLAECKDSRHLAHRRAGDDQVNPSEPCFLPPRLNLPGKLWRTSLVSSNYRMDRCSRSAFAGRCAITATAGEACFFPRDDRKIQVPACRSPQCPGIRAFLQHGVRALYPGIHPDFSAPSR